MRKLIFMLCLAFAMTANAQNCDKIYSQAVQCQQKMTIASQNQAIKYFQSAYNCYDSAAKKKLCISQIATCRNTIKLIRSGQNKSGGNASKRKQKVRDDDSLVVVNNNSGTNIEVKKNVELSVNENIVKFKANGKEFKKVKVICNYNDWKVVEKPDWITVSINSENEIVLEVSKNTQKEERSGIIKVKCYGTVVTFAVLQSKKTLFDKIGL